MPIGWRAECGIRPSHTPVIVVLLWRFYYDRGAHLIRQVMQGSHRASVRWSQCLCVYKCWLYSSSHNNSGFLFLMFLDGIKSVFGWKRLTYWWICFTNLQVTCFCFLNFNLIFKKLLLFLHFLIVWQWCKMVNMVSEHLQICTFKVLLGTLLLWGLICNLLKLSFNLKKNMFNNKMKYFYV